jgi:hypothetical protein
MGDDNPEEFSPESSPQGLAFKLASSLHLQNEVRQRILEARSGGQRLEELAEHLSAMIPQLTERQESVKRAGSMDASLTIADNEPMTQSSMIQSNGRSDLSSVWGRPEGIDWNFSWALDSEGYNNLSQATTDVHLSTSRTDKSFEEFLRGLSEGVE